MRVDGSEAEALVAPGLPLHTAWSPTEDRLAYVDEGTLVVRTPPAHWPWWTTQRIVRNATSEYAQQVNRFVWGPGGQWLVCEILEFADLSRDTPTRQVLRRVRRDGAYTTDLVMLHVEPDFAGETIQLVGWSGDGTQVLYWQGSAGHAPSSTLSRGLRLMTVPASGGEPRVLAAPNAVAPELAAPRPGTPSAVALVMGVGEAPFLRRELALARLGGEEGSTAWVPLSPSHRSVAAQIPEVLPAWSPDAEWIAYAAFPYSEAEPLPETEGVVAEELLNARLSERRIWVTRADGSDFRQITDDARYRDEWPRWSADGEHILFIRVREREAGLWLVKRDGEGPRRVVEEISVAPKATYSNGDRLFAWWQGVEPDLSDEDGVIVADAQGGPAQQVVAAFLHAVVDGEVEQALDYWYLEQPDESEGYEESTRRMIADWAGDDSRYVVGLTAYRGFVAPGDSQVLKEDDPRVESATVEVQVDGREQWFSLRLVDGRWRVEGIMTP
jgi:hypothetical protein